MTVKLHRAGYAHAQKLAGDGRIVLDERDDWSEHRPPAAAENAFIEAHGFREYGRWHLGVDDALPKDRKGHYKFPYGDFEAIHRCGVLAAESRAAQRKYIDIEMAAAHLHGMLEAMKATGTR
jgi:hypothetical protein